MVTFSKIQLFKNTLIYSTLQKREIWQQRGRAMVSNIRKSIGRTAMQSGQRQPATSPRVSVSGISLCKEKTGGNSFFRPLLTDPKSCASRSFPPTPKRIRSADPLPALRHTGNAHRQGCSGERPVSRDTANNIKTALILHFPTCNKGPEEENESHCILSRSVFSHPADYKADTI